MNINTKKQLVTDTIYPAKLVWICAESARAYPKRADFVIPSALAKRGYHAAA